MTGHDAFEPRERCLTQDAIHRRLAPILKSVGAGAAGPLDAIDLDSIGLVQLACAIEEEFQVTLDRARFFSMGRLTVGSMVSLIEDRQLHADPA